MKSFTTLLLFASAALATAQVTSNPNGTFTCALPNAAYCVGGSLSSNIIIRCNGIVGQPGNCDDNLDGEPPVGLNYAPCWESSPTAGDAACSKNCIVYGGSGNYNGTFTLPDCTPTYTATTSTATSSASSVSSSTSAPVTSYTTIVTEGTTITVPCSSGTPIIPLSTGVTPSTLITAPTGGASTPAGNGTVTSGAPSTTGGSATATPVGPTTSGPATVTTNAAVANQAGAVLAAGGLLVAYFL